MIRWLSLIWLVCLVCASTKQNLKNLCKVMMINRIHIKYSQLVSSLWNVILTIISAGFDLVLIKQTTCPH